MQTILPTLVILSLGVGYALLLSRRLRNIWITSILSGLLATATWGIIMEVLFSMVDFEKERGGTLWHIVFFVFLVTSISALIALLLKNKMINKMNQSIHETS